MRTKIRHLHGKLLASYWFVPTLLCAVAALAALLAVRYDNRSTEQTHRAFLEWVHVNTSEGARELLSTIASSTINLAGVIFSITILTISFASSQFGPRLLRNFMRDRPSQFVLGTFAATYVYCLLVLRTVGTHDDTKQIPHVAIAGALVLGVITIGVLIFFIHHIARAIQVPSVIASVGHDLDLLSREFLADVRQAPANPSPAVRGRATGAHRHRIASTLDGHVQALALEDLVEVAKRCEGSIHMRIAPGDHVTVGSPLADIFTPAAEAREWCDDIRDAIVIGLQRTNEQDLEFPIDQLSEIAVRALSPGVNDPFTAITCINQLGGGLRRLAAESWPEPVLFDQDGVPRVELLPTSMERLLQRAFGQILHYGRENPAIVRQVLKLLAEIASSAAPPHRSAVITLATRTYESAVNRRLADEAPDLAEFMEAIREQREPESRRHRRTT